MKTCFCQEKDVSPENSLCARQAVSPAAVTEDSRCTAKKSAPIGVILYNDFVLKVTVLFCRQQESKVLGNSDVSWPEKLLSNVTAGHVECAS